MDGAGKGSPLAHEGGRVTLAAKSGWVPNRPFIPVRARSPHRPDEQKDGNTMTSTEKTLADLRIAQLHATADVDRLARTIRAADEPTGRRTVTRSPAPSHAGRRLTGRPAVVVQGYPRPTAELDGPATPRIIEAMVGRNRQSGDRRPRSRARGPRERVRRASAGRARVVLVGGEAGIGKTGWSVRRPSARGPRVHSC